MHLVTALDREIILDINFNGLGTMNKIKAESD